MNFAFACVMSTSCVSGAHGGQKKASDPQVLKLRMIDNLQRGARTQTQVLCKSSKCILLLNHLSSPLWSLLIDRNCCMIFTLLAFGGPILRLPDKSQTEAYS